MGETHVRSEAVAPRQSDAGLRRALLAAQTAETAIQAFDNFDFSKGLEAVWALLGAVDKYIVAQAPWAKADGRDETLYTAAEVLRIACILLYPVIPGSITKIWEQLGMTGEPQLVGLRWGQLQAGQKITIPTTQAGTYYILAYAQGAAAAENYAMTAALNASKRMSRKS